MALVETRYFSPPLEKMSGLIAIIPDAPPKHADGRFPTVYQLHGLSDDYTVWQRRTRIEQLADKHGVMVVLLDGARSYYINSLLGRYEDHIVDAIRVVERLFPAARDATRRGIGGLSMGGYGSMKLGLKHPDKYASIAAHSGVLDIARMINERFSAEVKILAPDGLDAGDDIFKLAEKAAKTKGKIPNIRFDCGTEDFLLEHNRDLRKHLVKLGLPHVYEEFPGAHSWEYWDAHLDAALAHHVAAFSGMKVAKAVPAKAAAAAKKGRAKA